MMILPTRSEPWNTERAAISSSTSLMKRSCRGFCWSLCRKAEALSHRSRSQWRTFRACAARLCAERGGARAIYFCFRGAGELSNATGSELNRDLVCGIIRTALENYRLGCCFIDQSGELIGLTPAADGARLPVCFREISESIRLYTDKNCFAGGSDAFSDAAQLPRCIAQAKERAQGAFFYEQSHLFLQAASGERGCPTLEFLYEDAFTTMWRAKTQAQL